MHLCCLQTLRLLVSSPNKYSCILHVVFYWNMTPNVGFKNNSSSNVLHEPWLPLLFFSTYSFLLPGVSNSWFSSFLNLIPPLAAIVVSVFLPLHATHFTIQHSFWLLISTHSLTRPNQLILLDLKNRIITLPSNIVFISVVPHHQIYPSFTGYKCFLIIFRSNTCKL